MASATATRSATAATTTFTVTRWITLAVASGTFAALNGLFAKLTTTESTGSVAHGISQFLHLPDGPVEVVVRGICFALNLLSNFIMWALFTRALTAAPSTTKVSITNTSANFLVTAILGMIVFGERVRGLWWLGAAMMGAGCILVGMREEKNATHNSGNNGTTNRRRDGTAEEDEEEETITLDGNDANNNNGNGNDNDTNDVAYHDEEDEDGDAIERDRLLRANR